MLIGVAALGLVAWWWLALPPFGAGFETLEPVPWPDTSRLSSGDRERLEAQRNTVTELQAAPIPDREALAAAYGHLGEQLIVLQLNDAAAAALANAQVLQPKETRWSYFLGYVLAGNGDAEGAVPLFEAVIAAEPENTTARVRLTEALRDLGRIDEAKAAAEAALALDPTAAAAENLLGHLAADGGDPAAAIRHWEAALRLQPDASMLHHQLATAYRDVGDTVQAESHLAARGDQPVRLHDARVAELSALPVGAGAHLLRGGELMNAGRFEDAAAAFRLAVAENPEDSMAQTNLGAALIQLGDVPGAETVLRRAIELEPVNPKAMYNLALVVWNAGQTDEAEQLLASALAADPGNGMTRLTLARLEAEHGRCAEAAPHLRAYLDIEPTGTYGRRLLARCLMQLDDAAEAVTVLEAGLAIEGSNPSLVDGLVRVLAAAQDAAVRDGARALTLAEALAATDPDANREILAMALAAVGRFDEAVGLQQSVVTAVGANANMAALLPFVTANLEAYRAGRTAAAAFPPNYGDP